MDKVASLMRAARDSSAGAILGSAAGVLAHKKIQDNRNNARTKKGWDTRRRAQLSKEASDTDDIHEVKTAIRSLGNNLNHPSHAAAEYIQRNLMTKVRKIMRPANSKVNGGLNGR